MDAHGINHNNSFYQWKTKIVYFYVQNMLMSAPIQFQLNGVVVDGGDDDGIVFKSFFSRLSRARRF